METSRRDILKGHVQKYTRLGVGVCEFSGVFVCIHDGDRIRRVAGATAPRPKRSATMIA